jgi:hypothetical protein
LRALDLEARVVDAFESGEHAEQAERAVTEHLQAPKLRVTRGDLLLVVP